MDFNQAKQFYDQLKQDLAGIVTQSYQSNLVSTSNLTSELYRIQRGLNQLQQRSANPHLSQVELQYFQGIQNQQLDITQTFQRIQQKPQDLEHFTTTVNDGLSNMKYELKKVSLSLEQGGVHEQNLGNAVSLAQDESNQAIRKTNLARKFIKKNKDWCFLGIAVLEFIILFMMFIF
ncbi:hypothetical protein SS50377_25644 [Spironucleus salmonicida]|uniref:Uncharacterized protein n=1 Tax=Spironucleus salmonicida TaxID=348837 RepID=V6LY12_9EUKA|nr:hypothetical protein SS50377_25644 [Spironucleus salmonicida]|eukprot:EST49455.1 Hypothetical protein SS50377_10204 [Spironucleus salmonicida]